MVTQIYYNQRLLSRRIMMPENTNAISRTLISDRLITIRESLGINKAEAARRTGLTKMGYGRYESGQRSPSPQMIEFIALCLGTTSAYLTGESDDPAPDYIIISSVSEPELFNVISTIRNSDPDKLGRIMHYFESLQ